MKKKNNLPPEIKEFFSKAGKKSVKSRFAGMTPEEISEYMTKVSHSRSSVKK